MLTHFDREQKIYGARLKPYEKLLLLALNSFVDGNGECWPGKERLTDMTGLSKRSLDKHLEGLVRIGVLATTHRRQGQRQLSNLYKINFQALSGCKTGNSQGAKNALSGCKTGNSQGAGFAPDLSIRDLSNDLSRRDLHTDLINAQSAEKTSAGEPAWSEVPEIEPEPSQTTPVEVVDPEPVTPVNPKSSGEDECSAAPPRPVKNSCAQFEQQFQVRRVNQCRQFYDRYQKLAIVARQTAGSLQKAEQAWLELFPSGIPSAAFVEGFEAFLSDRAQRMKSKTAILQIPAFFRFLIEPHYREEAIAAQSLFGGGGGFQGARDVAFAAQAAETMRWAREMDAQMAREQEAAA